MTPYGLPADCYHCLLDEQPYYLVPPRLHQRPELSDPVIVNPSCWFTWHGPLPPDMAARTNFAEYFYPSDRIVWVEDKATLALWPFWVGTEYFDYLSRMTPGQPVTEELPAHVRWVLSEANVLVEPNHLGRRRKEWHNDAWSYAQRFERGYVPVPNLIHPFHLGALRRYYRHHTRTGSFVVGDEQVSRRFAAHNETVARFFHCQLAPAVSDIARTVVKPSYAYFVSYLSGAELTKHTDRAQCDYSITMCIDASPEPEAQSPWPIELETPDGAVRVYQHLGDALVYRGCNVPHSRDRLPEGLTSTSLLLHYVDETFEGDLS
jgi:hypothetical protein